MTELSHSVWLTVNRLPDGGYLVKALPFAAWSFRADTYEECREKAPASLWRHIRKVTTLSWNGWEG